MTICHRCGGEKPKSERYCVDCRKIVRAEMKQSGYLRPPPTGRKYRGGDAREDTFETKHQ